MAEEVVDKVLETERTACEQLSKVATHEQCQMILAIFSPRAGADEPKSKTKGKRESVRSGLSGIVLKAIKRYPAGVESQAALYAGMKKNGDITHTVTEQQVGRILTKYPETYSKQDDGKWIYRPYLRQAVTESK